MHWTFCRYYNRATLWYDPPDLIPNKPSDVRANAAEARRQEYERKAQRHYMPNNLDGKDEMKKTFRLRMKKDGIR